MQKLAQLDGVRLFDSLTLSQKFELMRGLQIRYYSQEQMIVRQGETGSEFFIIVQGQVQCGKNSAGGFVPVRTLGKGAHFGEVALLNNVKRTMTVRALDEVRLLCIDKEAFMSVADCIRKGLKLDYERDRKTYI